MGGTRAGLRASCLGLAWAVVLTFCSDLPAAPTPLTSQGSGLPLTDVGAAVRELASIERRGPDLENASWNEIVRDSLEAKRVLALREALLKAGRAAARPLLDAALACKRGTTLKLLLDLMTELPAAEAVQPLTLLLADRATDLELRRQLPRFVGSLGDASVLPVLESVATERDTALARESTFALGALPGRLGLPALYRLLRNGPPVPRAAAAEAMGELDEFAAVDLLIERLKDPDSFVRTFAQLSLTELTYRCSRDRPLQPEEQHRDFSDWWRARRGQPRERLLAESLEENVAIMSGPDPRKALERAAWLAELSFQPAPALEVLASPLATAAVQLEAVRWQQWAREHGHESRLEWFRQSIDRAIAGLQSPDATLSWPSLSQLTEMLALPATEPYLFRALWVRTPLSERQRLASVLSLWWTQKRGTYDPRGKKFW